MPVFCKIADPDSYKPCDWDLAVEGEDRAYLLALFDKHMDGLLKIAASRTSPPPQPMLASARRRFSDILDELRETPRAYGDLHVLKLTELRDRVLRDCGIDDAYQDMKRRENASAISIYPAAIAEADAVEASARLETLAMNLFAGNIFDMGSAATIDSYHANGGVDFDATRRGLRPRPWLIDDLDEFATLLDRSRDGYRKAMFFVDNAGADVILGAIPFARHLVRCSLRVILAANTLPSLNDVTAAELCDLLRQLAGVDSALAEALESEQLTVVPSGCTSPLIDLGKVSQECNHAAADCDLVILEGMGRAIESNADVTMTCDCLRLAMIKDDRVAQKIGGKLYDLVFRLDRRIIK